MARPVVIAVGVFTAGLVTLAIGWQLALKPYLQSAADGRISTPGLEGLFVRKDLAVGPGQPVCTDRVFLTPQTTGLRYLLVGAIYAPPKIKVTIRGPAVNVTKVHLSVGTPVASTPLNVDFKPATSEGSTPATVCLTPVKSGIGLVGTDEGRSAVVAPTSVAGKPSTVDVALTTYSSGKTTVGDQLEAAPKRIESAIGLPAASATWGLIVASVLLLTVIPLAALALATITGRSRESLAAQADDTEQK